MENEATLYFKHVIRILLSKEEFERIKTELSTLPIKYRKAFWNLVLAGFSTKLAFKNCKNLYELKKTHNVEYAELLRMILFIDTALKSGIYSKNIEMFEVN